MSDYYKSLITDEEVIKELVKESQRREGSLPTQTTRIKPNLNFFQRTVNHLVSNNNRRDKRTSTPKEAFRGKHVGEHQKHIRKRFSKSQYLSKKINNTKTISENENFLKQNKINCMRSAELFNNTKIISENEKFLKQTKINCMRSSELFNSSKTFIKKIPSVSSFSFQSSFDEELVPSENTGSTKIDKFRDAIRGTTNKQPINNFMLTDSQIDSFIISSDEESNKSSLMKKKKPNNFKNEETSECLSWYKSEDPKQNKITGSFSHREVLLDYTESCNMCESEIDSLIIPSDEEVKTTCKSILKVNKIKPEVVCIDSSSDSEDSFNNKSYKHNCNSYSDSDTDSNNSKQTKTRKKVKKKRKMKMTLKIKK